MSTSTSPTAQAPCLFFKRGQCKFGGRCKRSHVLASDPHTNSNHPMKDRPCFAWKKGNCSKGDDCPYYHKTQRPKRRVQGNADKDVAEGSNERNKASQLRKQSVEVNQMQRLTQADIEKEAIFSAEAAAALEATRQRSLKAQEKERQEVQERLLLEQDAQLKRDERYRVDALKTVQQVILGTTIVKFSAGVTIDSIVTGFESCRVQVKRLPLNAKEHEVRELFRAQGIDESKFHLIGLKKRDGLQEADIIVDGAAGRVIALGLDGIDFRGQQLRFLVNEGASGMNVSTGDISLTISWRKPTMRVVVSYDSADVAKSKMIRLNDTVVCGRKVKVEPNRIREGGPIDPCALLVSGLSLGERQFEVAAVFGGKVRVLSNPIEYNEELAINALRAHILQISGEGLKELKECNTDPIFGHNSLIAVFQSWDIAKRVRDSLADKRFAWIGRSTFRLWLSDPFQCCNIIPLQQYHAQRSQWNILSEETKPKKDVKLTFTMNPDKVIIRARGDMKPVGSLKVRVEQIARGERIDIWHKSFQRGAGRQFLDSVSSSTGAFVRADWRLKAIKVCGSSQSVSMARERLEAEMVRLQSLEYTVALKRQSFGFFARQGIDALKERFGEENVTLNISGCRITIRGGEEARHELKRLIDVSLDTVPQASNSPDSTCPICLDTVTSPVQLGCKHIYCSSCMAHCLTAETQTFPLCCIGDEGRCAIPISIPTIKKFLLPKQFDHLLESAFTAHIETHPQTFKYCPTPDCVQIYRCSNSEDTICCPSCLIEICPSCHEEGHKGMSCDERRIQNSTTEQERLNEEWAQTVGVKRCPGCNIRIEKNEGCNHMQCTLCKVHICWVCMGIFEKEVIYEHMATVHGGHYVNGEAQNDNGAAYQQQARLLAQIEAQRQAQVADARMGLDARQGRLRNQQPAGLHLGNYRRERWEEEPNQHRAEPYIRNYVGERREEAPQRREEGWGCLLM